jgi:hypothetical protein
MQVAYNQYVDNRNHFIYPFESASCRLNDTSNPGSFPWIEVPNEPGLYYRTVGADYILYAAPNGQWWYCVGDSDQHVIDGTGSDLADAKLKCEKSVLLAVLSCLEFLEW